LEEKEKIKMSIEAIFVILKCIVVIFFMGVALSAMFSLKRIARALENKND
jgi:hypothetical protein